MISSIEWVPQGVADPNPKKYELSQAEHDLIAMMENHNVGDGDTEAAPTSSEKTTSQKKSKKKTKLPIIENNLPADLRMDDYSDDEEDNEAARGATIGRLLVGDGMGGDRELEDDKTGAPDDDDEMQDDGNQDPVSDEYDSDDDLADVPDTREYMPLDVEGLNSIGFSQIGTNAPSYLDADDDDDDQSDADDVKIRPSDSIVVVAKTDEEFASLEVNIYERTEGNLYVHHDIPLPAFPLCLSHGDLGPTGDSGNFCAVGTFEPGIEIWNLDVLNALEPTCVLGGEDTTMADEIMKHNMMNSQQVAGRQHMLGGRNQSSSLKPGSHTDAVMALSWNKNHRQVIASGSADCTVKLWDVTQSNAPSKACASTLTHHKDKVQSVLWHPSEGTLLATGSYDRTVALVDAQAGNNASGVKVAKIPADCESLAWDPHNPQNLTVACEDGTVMCWDVRKFTDKTPLWSIVASEFGGVSDLSYNTHVPGMLATSSVDQTVTLWDTQNATNSSKPRAKMNKDMKVGKLFTLNFYPSYPWLLGCAGSGKEIAIWDMSEDTTVQKSFGGRSITAATEQAIDTTKTTSTETTKAVFDSTMTTNTSKSTDAEQKSSSASKKNKKKKKKKKVHRAGR